MPKFRVDIKVEIIQNYSTEVEADDQEQAEELGRDYMCNNAPDNEEFVDAEYDIEEVEQ
jgi:hypothetical protein